MDPRSLTLADLPYSEACERNQGPILAVMQRYLTLPCRALEIGSGTGQHAVHFAGSLPALTWQPTDVTEHLAIIAARSRLSSTANVLAPVTLDLRAPLPSLETHDAVYTANTLHIIAWPLVERLFAALPGWLRPGGLLFVYGPFRYRGAFTSDSNAAFDLSLRERDPASGIRDVEAVQQLASLAGLEFVADHPMPANNQLLVWRRPPRG